MNEYENQRPLTPEQLQDPYSDPDQAVVSATECTGMLPTPAADPEEMEAYHQIYDLPLPEQPGKRLEQLKQERPGE